MKGQEMLCLFGSNYPHTCRPVPFSLFLSVFLVVRCSVAAFPFIFSHNSCFLMFLSENVIMQSLLCEDASLDAARPLASTTITSYSHAFYLGFLNPDHSIKPFYSRALTQRSWHVQGGGKMAWGWKWGNERQEKVLPQKDLASLKITSTETLHLTQVLLWGDMCLWLQERPLCF